MTSTCRLLSLYDRMCRLAADENADDAALVATADGCAIILEYHDERLSLAALEARR